MELSDLGKKLGGRTGIDQIQKDLGKALAIQQPLAMFGSGGPVHIPQVTQTFQKKLLEVLADPALADAMLCNYDGPQAKQRLFPHSAIS